MKWLIALMVLSGWMGPCFAEDAYVFAYFKEPGSQGIYLALSRDGYKFEPLNDGQPWVKPEHDGEIMRIREIVRRDHRRDAGIGRPDRDMAPA